jgi:GNAT superfamily N-acetyltransferase
MERIGDAGEIGAVINDGAVAYRGVIPDDCWHEPYMALQELRAEMAAGVEFWGIRDRGELLAVMGLQPVKDVALIRHAYTRTEAQGRGLGSRLLEFLSGKTERPLLVGTWKAATWAVKFYEKRGFRLTGEAEKTRLLKKYWTIPDRQIETSVVLKGSGTFFR